MRLILAIGLGFLIACAAGCGGGGSGSGTGSGGSPPAQVIASAAANVAPVTVDCGPTPYCGTEYQTVNLLYVTVTICPPSDTTHCQTFDHVQVDNQSYGLRIVADAVDTSGKPLATTYFPPETQSSLDVAECAVFADGYSFGEVVSADVKIPTDNGTDDEVASGVPVQIIGNYSTTSASGVPTDCASQGTQEGTVALVGANGILGVGPFVQDCGPGCAPGGNNSPTYYYTCSSIDTTSAGGCADAQVAVGDQVSNPVAYFANDGNGVIIELPSVPSAGDPTVTGALVFGIGTEGNNGIGSATVIEASPKDGSITTTYKSQVLNESILDSGSNAYFFTDSSITQCQSYTDFYCPGSTLSLSATNSDSATESTVDFSIANAESLDQSNFAFNDLGGTLAGSLQNNGGGVFDWGLPFFFGRNVYTAIDGMTTSAGVGPYFAY